MATKSPTETLPILVTDRSPKGWEAIARRLLVEEMKRRKVTYKALSKRLEEIGMAESADTLNRKVNRRKFSTGFFLVCLAVLGVERVEVPIMPSTKPGALRPGRI